MKKFLLFLVLVKLACAQGQNTIGLTQYSTPNQEGYLLFSGISSTKSYLIDQCGLKVKEWNSSYRPGLSLSLTENGDLFRTGLYPSDYFGSGGGKGGILELYNWNGNLLWSYVLSDSLQCQHHDATVLPNGNILVIVWDKINSTRATEAGKNPTVTNLLNNQEVWSEKIMELQPIGTDSAAIVWEWKAWDHLIQDFDNSKANFGVVSDHPELLNVNYVLTGPPTNSDWLHLNSIDFDPVNNHILLSCHSFGEIWIIDHSTTTAEAASHSGGSSGKGGDLLYRWGNPMTYNRGSALDQQLFKQHHATYLKSPNPNAGKVLVFNNGVNRPDGNYTSIDIIDIQEAGTPFSTDATNPYLPADHFWSYSNLASDTFYAQNIGGVFPLDNGSFLITDGPNGRAFELNSNGEITWSYVNPVNNSGPMSQGSTPTQNTVFRYQFYPAEYAPFSQLSFDPGIEIELNPTDPSLCASAGFDEQLKPSVSIYPNPLGASKTVSLTVDSEENFRVEIYDVCGHKMLAGLPFQKQIQLDLSAFEAGMYVVLIQGQQSETPFKLMIEE